VTRSRKLALLAAALFAASSLAADAVVLEEEDASPPAVAPPPPAATVEAAPESPAPEMTQAATGEAVATGETVTTELGGGQTTATPPSPPAPAPQMTTQARASPKKPKTRGGGELTSEELQAIVLEQAGSPDEIFSGGSEPPSPPAVKE
jgi:hypothetical protein